MDQKQPNQKKKTQIDLFEKAQPTKTRPNQTKTQSTNNYGTVTFLYSCLPRYIASNAAVNFSTPMSSIPEIGTLGKFAAGTMARLKPCLTAS